MPNFRLSDAEANTLTAYLMQQKEDTGQLSTTFQQKTLTAFAAKKAQSLLNDKLSCLGCHRLGNAGGKIGPDLSNAGTRLKPAFVFSAINNPREILPHSIMPEMFLTPETVELIANYILQQKTGNPLSSYLSLTQNPLILPEANEPVDANTKSAKFIYAIHCAACHGIGGDGKGFNAKFLSSCSNQACGCKLYEKPSR